MIDRILLAVDDSAASLAAAHAAIEIAAATGATVKVLHVIANSELAAALRSAACTGLAQSAAATSLLAHMAGLAAEAGVTTQTEQTAGEPARCVLDRARSWQADLVVLGRANRCGPGQPYVGHHTQHILEFAEGPVLTVPPPA